MDRISAVSSAVGAGLFVGSVVLLLPPTHTKASWTSASYTHPARVYDQPAPVPEQPAAYPAVYAPPREIALTSEPDDRSDSGADTSDAATEREIAIANDDRAYGDGYAWAADREVQGMRECRRLDGPGAEGCRDYVASLAPAMQDSVERALN
ncbi:hypothetical protein HL653_15660 [Sphingomonas sp. AP4-R1]|uniref:hypothetical protein n=1 Tax=Sphingomonas sp. AP4-R1 TaxID=2735134 RepID=UPI00149378EF|nr:hypothetical protein [Sphingomonas sp. AP4-R1]QJU59008.1 hypothetical protein HL653_15660 [Sphingomonas sp. AP4-R1]